MKQLYIYLRMLWYAGLAGWVIGGALASGQSPEVASFEVRCGGNGGSATGIHPRVAITNAHVVEATGRPAHLKDNAGKTWRCEVVAVNPRSDLALLHVKGEDIPYVAIAENDLNVGDEILAYGYGFGDQPLRSARGKVTNVADTYHSNLVIQSGDSGCGLFNTAGQLVGVNHSCDNRFATQQYVQGYSYGATRAQVVELCQAWQQRCGPGGCQIVPYSQPSRPRQDQRGDNWMKPVVPEPVAPPLVPVPPKEERNPPPAQPPAKGCECNHGSLILLLQKQESRMEKMETIVEKLASLPVPAPGKDGRDGKDAVVDYDKIDALIKNKLRVVVEDVRE